MHLKLKLLSGGGRGAVAVHRMELGDRCSSYAKLVETVSALTTEPLNSSTSTANRTSAK